MMQILGMIFGLRHCRHFQNNDEIKRTFSKDIVVLQITTFLGVLVVFSACGGIRSGSTQPVSTAEFPMLAYGIFGKGGLFVSPPLEDCLTWLRALLPLLEHLEPRFVNSVAII